MERRSSKKTKDHEIKEDHMEVPEKKWKWWSEGTLFCGTTNGDKDSAKLALFDMDGTLIEPKSGKAHSVNYQDWKLWDPSVPAKLKTLSSQGYRIIIVSNQMGVEKGHTTTKELSMKVEDFSKDWDLEMSAFMATAEDQYRKPARGIWEFITKFNKEKIDLESSFFVGDAAGRPASGKEKKKDFSTGDAYFAHNCGLKFYTPEMYFRSEKEVLPPLPKTFAKQYHNDQLFKGKAYTFDPKAKHMVFFIGSPGSGKSTFWKNYMKDYLRVNHDELHTQAKGIKLIKEMVASGNPRAIVIDNTNCTTSQREGYLEVAKEIGYKPIAFVFQMEKDAAMYLDKSRVLNNHRKHLSKKVGSIPIHTFFKNNQPPTAKEGFEEIYNVLFVLKCEGEQDEAYYNLLQ